MLRLRALFIALSCSLALPALAPTAARAQGGADGSIVGYVFDQSGNPLAGIAITATSPNQIGG
jgi:hypothetical protein